MHVEFAQYYAFHINSNISIMNSFRGLIIFLGTFWLMLNHSVKRAHSQTYTTWPVTTPQIFTFCFHLSHLFCTPWVNYWIMNRKHLISDIYFPDCIRAVLKVTLTDYSEKENCRPATNSTQVCSKLLSRYTLKVLLIYMKSFIAKWNILEFETW